MKILLLIVSLILVSLVSSRVLPVRKNIARTVQPEELALEIEFAGSCREFADRVLPTVTVSAHAGCLPIQVGVPLNPDNNDLNTHHFCTKIRKNKSIVHFVEIFSGSSDDVQHPDYVVSFVPTAPFRILTPKTSLARRPDCSITHDYCNATNAVVAACRTNDVAQVHHYIVSHDRIYITGGQAVSHDCKTDDTVCCPYIAPEIFGGICPREASRDRLNFPSKYEYGRPSQQQQQQEQRPVQQQQEQEQEQGYGRPQEQEERPVQQQEQEHGRPQEHGHGRPQEHGHGRPQEHGRPQHSHGRPQEEDDEEDDDKRKK